MFFKDELKKFECEYSHTSSLSPDDIYNRWTDISKWQTWDGNTSSAVLIDQDFKAGSRFRLIPKGGEKEDPLMGKIIELEKDKYHGRAETPFGTVDAIYKIEKFNDENEAGKKGQQDGTIKLTHTFTISVPQDKVAVFEKDVWPNWKKGTEQGNKNIATGATVDGAEDAEIKTFTT